MEFKVFQQAVAKQFQTMVDAGALFRSAVDTNLLWDLYLQSFPEGTNPLYRKRTEHDCTACRHFIRTIGGLVSMRGDGLMSIWDIDIDGPFKVVADALAAAVKAHPIENIFLHSQRFVGVATTRALLEDKSVQSWNHFYVSLPERCVQPKDKVGPMLSEYRGVHDVFVRSLREITRDAIDTVLDLISQGSLYRGEEMRATVQQFSALKAAAGTIPDHQLDSYAWGCQGAEVSPVYRIRNTAIGTLLVDLSEGKKDLEGCLKTWEQVMAPANYKRPTAPVTKAMIAAAQDKVNELGIATALERRYATIDDITINNLVFADRSIRQSKNVFESLAASLPERQKSFDRVEEISIEDFITNVIPRADTIEAMFENGHANNLVSLIAPADASAPLLFKWCNPFSWSYAGEFADSIKEKVKRAGGRVEAALRCSLAWFNYDDLDLHLIEPNGYEIFYRQKISPQTSGQLDVDMNAGGGHTRNAVENIFYPEANRIPNGEFRLYVHNYSKRESCDVGFDAEIEFGGTTYSFHYGEPVPNGYTVQVARFVHRSREGLTFIESLPSTQASKTVWSIPTQTFHRVNAIMLSPNYWGERPVGNKHYFFMLDACRNEGKARGFYNEFLTDDLTQHRKVLEVVGSKMKTEESDRQLSGLGFSSTQRNHLICKVTGSFTRTVKVTF